MIKYGYGLDIAVTLDYLSQIDGGGPYDYTGDVSANTQTVYTNNLIWLDGRTQPSWSDILANYQAAADNYYGVSSSSLQDIEDCYVQLNDEKANTAHSHTISNITGLTAALAAKADVSSMPAARSVSTVTPTLNSSAAQISTTRDALVSYHVDLATTLSLTTGQTGTATLSISIDNITFTEIARFTNGNSGTLAIGLGLTQTVTGALVGYVPAGYYRKIVTSGTGTFTSRAGQEILL